MQSDIYRLPPNLPVPENDGAAAHLSGMEIPDLTLESSLGPVKLRDLGVLYIYPRTGRPGRDAAPGWDQIPGARGCTPESCAFRDAVSDFEPFSLSLAGFRRRHLMIKRNSGKEIACPFP
jgi:peroxiredoxin